MRTATRHALAEAVGRSASIVPGTLISVVIALAAFGLHQLPGLTTLSIGILAVFAGAVVSNAVQLPLDWQPGIRFSSQTLLRLGIVLLGIQIPIGDVLELGAPTMLLIVIACVSTFCLAKGVGHLLGVDRKLAELIGAGTAICGASAILAVNSATRARPDDVGYAISCVTLFGTILMLGLPSLAVSLGMSAELFSVWAGASIHEVGQVAAAASQFGQHTEDLAMISKLGRVLLLGPLVLTLLLVKTSGPGIRSSDVPLVPGFIICFGALIALANTIELPQPIIDAGRATSTWLLAIALGALGLSIRIDSFRKKGLRPAILAGIVTFFITALTMGGLFALSDLRPL